MSLSRRAVVVGLAAAAALPESAHGSTPAVVAMRSQPPVAGWPAWTPIDPSAAVPAEFRIAAGSLQFLEPAPGYRLVSDGAGVVFHEPA